MPRHDFGCLSTRCRHEFEADCRVSERVLERIGRTIKCGPPCPKCGAITKWIPGLTNIARPMPEGGSFGRTADRILRLAVDRYNEGQTLPGMKIGDVHCERDKTLFRPAGGDPERTVPMTFRDASGVPWRADVPVSREGSFINGNSWPVRADQGGKVSTNDSGRLGHPWVPKQLTATPLPHTAIVASDRK